MENIKLNLNKNAQGAFYMMNGDEQIGEMVISISERNLTVHHTEVVTKAEGKGFAKKMVEFMVAYAREHQLKVIPLCPYVYAQFKRHEELYADVWKKEEM